MHFTDDLVQGVPLGTPWLINLYGKLGLYMETALSNMISKYKQSPQWSSKAYSWKVTVGKIILGKGYLNDQATCNQFIEKIL